LALPARAQYIDEKPSIQALERAQGYLKLPNGRALKNSIRYGNRSLSWSTQARQFCCGAQ
jgi:hypothetical protein